LANGHHCLLPKLYSVVVAAAAFGGLQEIKLSEDGTTYTTIQRCPVHYAFEHENKG
jgi:hypothetical protein